MQMSASFEEEEVFIAFRHLVQSGLVQLFGKRCRNLLPSSLPFGI